MVHNITTTRISAYNYSITYEKPQSELKDLSGTNILTEKNDMDNDVYRNAATKSTMIANVERYSQGTFDLSLLVAGNGADSYFSGSLGSAYDVDYFYVDTMSQRLSRRPVMINMEMPEGADYSLAVYDDKGNQVGMAVKNEDGTKTLTIPCDWSSSRSFVIKVSQNTVGTRNVAEGENGTEVTEQGNYKLTFSQGEMPKEVRDALEQIKTAEILEGSPEKRAALLDVIKTKQDTRNAAEMRKLHQIQYDALPEELKYKGSLSAKELLEKEKQGEKLTDAEQAYIAIYGNQNDIYQVEGLNRKQGLEQEFSAYLESIGLSGKEFNFRLEVDGTARVTGLEGEEAVQVKDFLEEHWNRFKNVYLENSKECTEMTDQEYRIAGYVEECSRLLAGASNGKSSVKQLSIVQKSTNWYISSERIAGLPAKLDSLINNADSTSKYYEYKQMLYSIINYKRENGEIPEYDMEFQWDGELVV